MDDQALLREAIRLARVHSASGVNGPFGSVVARGGEVVGEGWNRVIELGDPTAHAEVLAIRAAAARLGNHVLADCVLYTSCEPCPMCLAAAYWARIPRVVFAASKEDAAAAGFEDHDIYLELPRAWAERRVRGEQLLSGEGRAVLEAWRANPHRVDY
ncbi:MAG: nucleoside deaminase [Longimicrobiales bacterium]|nr:nucleoside deaminase [Longimicrobiales bacterium]